MILPRFFQNNEKLTKSDFRKLEARNPSSSRSPLQVKSPNIAVTDKVEKQG